MTSNPAPMRVPVVTGLDLPADAAGGSVELLYDLYSGPDALLGSQAFMLQATGDRTSSPRQPDKLTRPAPGLTVLDVPGKCMAGPPFWRYVTDLTAALAAALTPPQSAVVHLQHLAFGASPALIGAYPALPRIALVHGTDLLYAETNPTQLHVLHHVIAAAAKVVVPTTAMADRLRALAPHLNPDHLVHIPWGVPDQLLSAKPSPHRHHDPRRADDQLRLLYAGRLTPEKGGQHLVQTCAALPGVRLSLAAPAREYNALTGQLADRLIVGPAQPEPALEYLGWLPRPRLWEAFADHDLLVVPSTTLEAFGLVAIEAQACGLPVAYQPVPGLTEVLAGSAVAVDLADPAAFAAELRKLRADPTTLTELRTAGLANAARYPLSRTAARLADLTEEVANRSPDRSQVSK